MISKFNLQSYDLVLFGFGSQQGCALKMTLCLHINSLIKELVSIYFRYRSVEHRVLPNSQSEESEFSIAVFLKPYFDEVETLGPIKELVLDKEPAHYRQFRMREYVERIRRGERGGP